MVNIHTVAVIGSGTMGAGIAEVDKQIKQAMLEKNIKVSDLAEKIGMKPQPLSTKLYRDTMSYSDVEKIADALGCDVRIVDRETGKTF